jgi:hypothetical protein
MSSGRAGIRFPEYLSSYRCHGVGTLKGVRDAARSTVAAVTDRRTTGARAASGPPGLVLPADFPDFIVEITWKIQLKTGGR